MPLLLPIEAGVEELRNAVGTPGRYRVDPVDEHRPIPNAPDGYVFVSELPKTSTGKLMKTRLRETYRDWTWRQT